MNKQRRIKLRKSRLVGVKERYEGYGYLGAAADIIQRWLVPEESASICRRRRSSVPDQVRQLKSRRPPIQDPSPTVTMFTRQALLRSARAAAPSRAIASQARFYAAPAAPAATETVKAPVALFGVDGTYATALVRHRAESNPRRRRWNINWDTERWETCN